MTFLSLHKQPFITGHFMSSLHISSHHCTLCASLHVKTIHGRCVHQRPVSRVINTIIIGYSLLIKTKPIKYMQLLAMHYGVTIVSLFGEEYIYARAPWDRMELCVLTRVCSSCF